MASMLAKSFAEDHPKDCSKDFEVQSTLMLGFGSYRIKEFHLFYCNDSETSIKDTLAQAETISKMVQVLGDSNCIIWDPKTGDSERVKKLHSLRVTLFYNPPKSHSPEDEDILSQGRFARDLAKVITKVSSGLSHRYGGLRDQVFVIAHGNGSELLYQSLLNIEEDVREVVTVCSLNGTKNPPPIFASEVISLSISEKSDDPPLECFKPDLKRLLEQKKKSTDERLERIRSVCQAKGKMSEKNEKI